MQPNKNGRPIGRCNVRQEGKLEATRKKNMKSKLIKLTAALAAGTLVSLGQIALAQVAVTESSSSTTTSMGTISEFNPTGDTVVLRSETSTEPMRYSYSKSTTIVDEAGAPVDVSIVKSGVPVQVMYVKEGDRMVAKKIVVKKKTTTSGTAPAATGVMEKKETSTTTTTH